MERGNSRKYCGIPHGGFYTQKQVRSIVRYVANRNIEIIPEIDMPGHILSALDAYNELGCTGRPYEIFPSKYIHIGGDKCKRMRWAKCPKCQSLIRREKLFKDGGRAEEKKCNHQIE